MVGIYPKGINPDGDYRMDIEVEGVGEGRQDQLLIRPHPDGLGYTILLNDEDIYTAG